jgi:hypothetical protein
LPTSKPVTASLPSPTLPSVWTATAFDRHGTLDFIDNAVNRSSGTIHARATVPNPDLSITPGQFARLRVSLGKPAPALLVPAAAVVPDQSRHIVMTVAADGTIVPKQVEIGDLYHGLRTIRSGLSADDRVVIDGLVRARPGIKVTPIDGDHPRSSPILPATQDKAEHDALHPPLHRPPHPGDGAQRLPHPDRPRRAGDLPVAQYPEIVPPTVQVTTSYPGASAEVVSRPSRRRSSRRSTASRT